EGSGVLKSDVAAFFFNLSQEILVIFHGGVVSAFSPVDQRLLSEVIQHQQGQQAADPQVKIPFLKREFFFDFSIIVCYKRMGRELRMLGPVARSNLFQDSGVKHDDFCNTGWTSLDIVDFSAVNKESISFF